jgi:hypothetical protein
MSDRNQVMAGNWIISDSFKDSGYPILFPVSQKQPTELGNHGQIQNRKVGIRIITKMLTCGSKTND